MIALGRERTWKRTAVALGLGGLLGLGGVATAQAPRGGQVPGRAAVGARGQAPAPGQPAAAKPAANQEPAHVELKYVPVNPTDPVAVVNNEIITRQQLADECVARKGEEILETMIARRLIEQAMKANKLEVTEAEIFAEIDKIAATMAGVSREQWLRSLAKDRNISPAQYARDVIYPALALRKLAMPRVQITEQDIQDAYESQFGERLVYRMVMCRTADHAKQVWEELKKNPGGFEHIAMNDPRSIDPATKATGGKPVTGPLQRHAFPRDVTDKIFRELVDGDPNDKDADHKPKDGDISGAIQIAEDAWIIVKREAVIPAQEYDKNDKDLAASMRSAITESKIQQHMEEVYNEVLVGSAIENKLTGTIKQPQKEVAKVGVDPNIQRISQPPAPAGARPEPNTTVSPARVDPAAQPKLPPPPGVSERDIKATRLPAAKAPATNPAPKK